MSEQPQRNILNTATPQGEAVLKELGYLSEWLEDAGQIKSLAIVGSPIEMLAGVVRRCVRSAPLFLIVQGAKELDVFRATDFGRGSTAVGMDFDAIDGLVEVAILRIGGYEGKEMIRRRLQSATRRIELGGTAVVLTHTKRGASTQLAMLRELFGNGEIVARGGGGFRILAARLTAETMRTPTTATPCGESHISEEVLGESFEFVTSPAVFSRDRIDSGTRLLLETLPPVSPRTILDFGCGYGVMGIVLARRSPSSRVTMIDVDVAAVDLARANAALNRVDERTRIVLSDGLTQLSGERFDLAVTHFPLHIPRGELERLLIEIRDALEPNGCLYGVMLNAYELRPLVERVFGNVETVGVDAEKNAERAYSIVRACRR